MDDHIIRKISKTNMFQFDKKIPSQIFKYYSITATGVVKVINIKLSKLINDTTLINDISYYDELTFRPIGLDENDYIEPERSFNTWNGFQAQRVDKVDMSKIQIILDHIKNVWASSNEEYYKYLLNWFKVMFTNPSFKTKVAIVLKSSDKQIGKGIIINDFLIPFVFGTQYSMSIAGLDTITAKFNQVMMNKLFVNCDELSTIDGSYHQSFDVLKKRITDKTIKIEIKGGKSFIYPDFCNYIMCTNNDFTIRMERGDCRYFVLECSSIYKGNYAYFSELNEAFNQDSANHFYTYICGLASGVIIRDIPMTDLKMQMIIASLQNPTRFLMSLKEGKTLYDCHECDENLTECSCSELWVDYKTLYQTYIMWCDTNREKCLSLIKFGKDIKDVIIKKKISNFKYDLKSIKVNL